MTGRTLAIGLAAVVLVGCTGGASPAPSAPDELRVTSPAFTDGGPIPVRFTCDGGDDPPPIRWSGATGRGSIVLEMTDADADGFVHWLVYDLGGRSGSVGGSSAAGEEGRNDFGTSGYRGPCPPQGDPLHHYAITMYEFLPVPSPFVPGEDPDQVIGDDPIAMGTLTAIYSRAG